MSRKLTITADDFGLWPSYDAGMLEAVGAAALDAVGVMVLRVSEVPGDLAEASCAVGVHLEVGADGTLLRGDVVRQVDAFAQLFGRPPDYLDGHHHCHAGADVVEEVAAIALELGVPMRSVSEEHRALLREAGVRTPDRLIGRYEERDPVLPAELDDLPEGWTEWMVHPGHPDPASGSNYDAGRGEDLEALLALEVPDGIERVTPRDLT